MALRSQGNSTSRVPHSWRHLLAVSCRMSGVGTVPLTLAAQQILVQAFQEVVVPVQGPAELISYRSAASRPRGA